MGREGTRPFEALSGVFGRVLWHSACSFSSGLLLGYQPPLGFQVCGALGPEMRDGSKPGLHLLLGFSGFDRSRTELGKETRGSGLALVGVCAFGSG